MAGSSGHRVLGMPVLFFDLDGPLLDVRQRYYGVYRSIADELEVQPLDQDPYWEAKREQAPLRVFFPGSTAGPSLRQQYQERWLDRIEQPAWLELDTLVPDAEECLSKLAGTFSLCLVTLRRDPDALAAQLARLDLRQYFASVRSGWLDAQPHVRAVSDPGRGGATPASGLKARWIQELLDTGSRGVAMVGDTEVDMFAARSVPVTAIGVSFGIRRPADLRRWGADQVVDNLRELLEILDCSGIEEIKPTVCSSNGERHQPVSLTKEC